MARTSGSEGSPDGGPDDQDLDPAFQNELDSPIFGLTERERRFAAAYFEVTLAAGSDSGLITAYRRAFPLADCGDRVAFSLARGLVNNSRVTALVTRLRERLSERRMQPAERLILDLERIAYSNILDYCKIDPETGSVTMDLRSVDHSSATAIQEITTNETLVKEVANPNVPGGVIKIVRRQTKVRLYDKLNAIDKLARMHGLIKDRGQDSWTIEDLERAIRLMEQKLIDRGVTIDNEPAPGSSGSDEYLGALTDGVEPAAE